MHRRVRLLIDCSRPGDSVVSAILRMADSRHADVLLVRVVEPIPPDAVESSRHRLVNSGAARMREARESMTPIAARLRARGLRVMTHVRRGAPVPEILAAAREAEVDFIAMTNHSRDALGQLPFDSAAEAVLRGADIPILIVPSAERSLGARTDHELELEAGTRVA